MGDLAGLLTPDRVRIGVDARSKRQVLQRLADDFAGDLGLPAADLLRALLEREKLGTTGIGEGLAIPHAKLAEIDRVAGFFMRLDEPVDFDALDERAVDLVFCLLAPADLGAEHLKALARVARTFRDADLCARLRAAPTPAAVFDLLVPPAASSAA
ncbi:MAG: PTS IIA-like nitrogen regulatory protein PtsN [Geminicoccaceae bacterium]|nr:PTS IIA-like nitrogen regulatory protein PtsN [Geminicoccaceae bacterium]